MSLILDLKAQRAKAVKALNEPAAINDAAVYDNIEKEIAEIDAKLARAQKAQERSAALARPAGEHAEAELQDRPSVSEDVTSDDPSVLTSWSGRALAECRKAIGFNFKKDRHFANLGEQLISIVNYQRGHGSVALDPRLIRAPLGAGELDPSGGGFLMQPDFMNVVLTRMYKMGEIASRVDKLPGLTSNSIKIPAIDETSRANGSRYGGVLGYWVAEGNAPTATNIKTRQIELDLKKVAALYYASDELLADTNLFSAISTRAFAEEITFQTEDAYWEGSGTGQPLGIMNAPCKVTVAKETGQATKTIVYENVLNMYSRMWAPSRANAVWFINQDVEPQLYGLSQTIGTAGVPVYLPAGGISGNPYGTMFGRPVIPIEYASTLGTEGDIVFADFSQYVAVDKGGPQMASSMHVQFLTDQMVFRLIYRVDGEPWWSAPLTPFKGSATKSPFITLATR